MPRPLILSETFAAPVLTDFKAYRDLARREERARAAHQAVRPIREARTAFVHSALRGRAG